MIGPKEARPTEAQERRAYGIVTERDDDLCVKCRRGLDIQRDHRKNRSQMGRTVPSNLQLLCLKCHAWKGAHPDEAEAQGWAVPGWADPLTYPAARWFRTPYGMSLGWVLYRDNGTFERITTPEAERRIREGVLA